MSDPSHQCSSQGLGQAQVDSLPALAPGLAGREEAQGCDPRRTRPLGNHCRAVASDGKWLIGQDKSEQRSCRSEPGLGGLNLRASLYGCYCMKGTRGNAD